MDAKTIFVVSEGFHRIHSVIHIFTSFLRLETRMTADINVILQLLQRQIAPVPPAYSSVSSSTLPTDSPSLYGTGMHSMYPMSPLQMDTRAPTQVSKITLCLPVFLFWI